MISCLNRTKKLFLINIALLKFQQTPPPAATPNLTPNPLLEERA